MSPDPALEEYLGGSPNQGVFAPMNLSLFNYGNQNPLKYVDPTGRSPNPDERNEWAGSVTVGTGTASVVRIPVPNSGGLHLELRPRGWVPKTGTTSTVFIQSMDGKTHLRLDYGYNKATGQIEYHWNQKGTAQIFNIRNHQTAAPWEAALYKGAKYFKFAGRVLRVAGIASDAYAIVTAEKHTR